MRGLLASSRRRGSSIPRIRRCRSRQCGNELRAVGSSGPDLEPVTKVVCKYLRRDEQLQ